MTPRVQRLGRMARGGIRRRLVLLVLAAVLPILAFAAIATWRFASAERDALERGVTLRAEALARAVDAEFGTVVTALRAIAASAAFQETDLPSLHALMAAVGNDLGGSITLRDERGRLLLHSSFTLGRPLPATGVDALVAAMPRYEGPIVVDLQVSPVTGVAAYGVVLPVQNVAGRALFLSAGFPPMMLLDTVRREVPARGWTAAVVDRANRVVIRSVNPEATTGRDAGRFSAEAGRVWRATNPDGTAVVAATARTAGGWTAGVSQEASAVDAPVRRAVLALSGLGALMTGAAIVLALLAAERIAGTIGRLSDAAAALGAGAPVALRRSGLLEVDSVQAALSDAAATIAARNAALADREAALARTQRLARVGGFEIEVTHTRDGPRFRNIRSPEYLALHGLPPDAADEPHEAWERRIHREDRERVAAEFARAVGGSGAAYAQEYRIVTPRGDQRWISARAEIQRDATGRATRIRGVHLDVTDLRRTEARLAENEMALAAAEERLRLALEAGDLVAWEVDAATGIGTASAGHFRMLGIPMTPDGHSLLKDWERVVLPEDRPVQDAARHRAMEGDGIYDSEIRIRRADGTIRWIASVGRRVPGSRRVIGVYADVTERKAAEELLRARVREAVAAAEAAQAALAQARKLEALGHLTGGVAHDFNNLLQVVASGATLLRKRAGVAGDPGALRLLDGIGGAAERGASLVARMLAFARRQELRMEAVEPAALIRSMRDILARSLGPAVPVELDLPPSAAWWVRTDPNQLELALLNLCVNARDAMPPDRFPDGRVRIAVRHVPDGTNESTADALPPAPGDWIMLSVTDTGAGMDAETLARAMEPFFTTKEVGRGTGLGLSMVHGLCEQSGGTLRLRSTPGGGTTAEIWLPRAAAPECADHPVDAAPGDSQGRRLTVLVVDDDPLVLASTVALVGDLGHAATAADSAEAALRLLRDGTPADVLLTDHAMPGVTGLDLARRAAALRPDLPVVLASGYADLPEGAAEGLVRLDKPFSRDALARALTEAASARVA